MKKMPEKWNGMLIMAGHSKCKMKKSIIIKTGIVLALAGIFASAKQAKGQAENANIDSTSTEVMQPIQPASEQMLFDFFEDFETDSLRIMYADISDKNEFSFYFTSGLNPMHSYLVDIMAHYNTKGNERGKLCSVNILLYNPKSGPFYREYNAGELNSLPKKFNKDLEDRVSWFVGK